MNWLITILSKSGESREYINPGATEPEAKSLARRLVFGEYGRNAQGVEVKPYTKPMKSDFDPDSIRWGGAAVMTRYTLDGFSVVVAIAVLLLILLALGVR